MKKNKDYGFLRVAAAIPRVRIAGPEANAAAICSLIDKAFEKGVSLLAFPELSVTGYSCADLFGQDSLLDAAEKAIGTIRNHSRGKSVTIVAGAPIRHGGRLYDCAVVIRDGNVLGVVPKVHVSGSDGSQGPGLFSSGSDFLSMRSQSASAVYNDGKSLFREGFSPLVEICSQRVNISQIGRAHV